MEIGQSVRPRGTKDIRFEIGGNNKQKLRCNCWVSGERRGVKLFRGFARNNFKQELQ